MLMICKKMLFRVLIGLLIFIPFIGVTETGINSQSNLIKEIDALFNRMVPPNGPGAAVLAIHRDKVIIRKGYGMANIELGVPMKPEMVFRLGSITKQFTAAAIMTLVDDGKISLVDEITKFIPDYPTRGNKIIIHHLLNHTSGIKDYYSVKNYRAHVRKDYSPEEMVNLFKNEPLDFTPGADWSYSNSGYFLLGVIIEKASKRRYQDFIQDRLFKPLGMKHTFMGSHSRIIPGQARGYQYGANGLVNADFLSMTQPFSAGGLLSSVDDLWLWTKALHTGKLVSAKSFRLMTVPTRLGNGQTIPYGFGTELDPLFKEKKISHGGGISGFSSQILYLPEKEVFVVVLLNSFGGVNVTYLAQWTAARLAGKDVAQKKAITLAPDQMDRITGKYEIAPGVYRTIFREGSRLFSQRSGGARLEVFASSENEFFYKDSFVHFTIVKDKKGKVIKMIMHGQGDDEEAKKID